MEMLITVFEKYCKDILKQSPHEWFGVSQTAWSNYKKVGIPEKHRYKIFNQLELDYETPKEEVVEVIIRKYYEKL